jgi:hypothetical protein
MLDMIVEVVQVLLAAFLGWGALLAIARRDRRKAAVVSMGFARRCSDAMASRASRPIDKRVADFSAAYRRRAADDMEKAA